MASTGDIWLQWFSCCFHQPQSPRRRRHHQRLRIDRSMIGNPTNFVHTGKWLNIFVSHFELFGSFWITRYRDCKGHMINSQLDRSTFANSFWWSEVLVNEVSMGKIKFFKNRVWSTLTRDLSIKLSIDKYSPASKNHLKMASWFTWPLLFELSFLPIIEY